MNPWDLLVTLQQRSPRIRQLLTAYTATVASHQVYTKAAKWLHDRTSYTVTVPSTDGIYDDLHERLLGMLPEKARRAITVGTVRGNRSDDQPGEILPIGMAPASAPSPDRLVTFYDSDTSQTLVIAGHKIVVAKEKDAINLDDAKTGGDIYYRHERLKFSSNSEAGRKAVLAWLTDIVESRAEVPNPRFYIMTRWGDWDRRQDLEPRSFDTVVLRKGLREDLIEDIGTFLAWRNDYQKYGIPYHRGYLLYGPPGTGKTTVARAVAAYYGLDMYYAPLSDVDKDANLIALMSRIKPGSVLLLEDVDVMHAARDRDDDKQGITLSGLLNSLDGVSTPSGIITIMTSNHADVLDDALVRPGRVDRKLLIDYLDDEQLDRLMVLLAGEHVTLPSCAGLNIAPADVLEAMKRHLQDPKAGVTEVRELLESRS